MEEPRGETASSHALPSEQADRRALVESTSNDGSEAVRDEGRISPDPDAPDPEASEPGAITQLLRRYADGDSEAFDQLVPLVYADLHRLASLQLRRLRPGRTLETTGLVHEAYVKLVEGRSIAWNDRDHFFAVAAAAMRQILIDHARYLTRHKRGGQQPTLQLNEETAHLADDAQDLLDLDRALRKLAEKHPRVVRVVECRYFAGLTGEETAAALGIARRTVHRDWLHAQAWLRRELGSTP